MSITNVAYPAISILLIYVTASSNSGRSVLNAARWPPSSCTLPLQPKHTNMLAIARSGHISPLSNDFVLSQLNTFFFLTYRCSFFSRIFWCYSPRCILIRSILKSILKFYVKFKFGQ